MPPPPAAITTTPASEQRSAPTPRSRGRGEATTRRKAAPRPPRPPAVTRPRAALRGENPRWASPAGRRPGRRHRPDVGQHGHGVPEPAERDERVVEAGRDVADTALRVGDRHVEREPAGRRRVLGDQLRRRMKPTCGPLPCVTITRQPAATSTPIWRANAAVLELLGDRAPLALANQRVPADRDQHGRRLVTRAAPSSAARPRSAARNSRAARRDARADLADARLAVRDAGVDDRRHAALDDATEVDPGRGPREAEGGQGVLRVSRQRDPPHRAGQAHGVGRSAAHEAHDRRGAAMAKPPIPASR